MTPLILSLCLAQAPALGPASLDFGPSGMPPEQPYRALVGGDAGVAWAGVSIPGLPPVMNTGIWFKVGAVTPPGQVRVMTENGGVIRSSVQLTPNAWNVVRAGGPFTIQLRSIRIVPMFDTTFEVEALAQPSEAGARDDTPNDVPGPLLLPSGAVPRSTAAVVFEHTNDLDPYAPACAVVAPSVHGNPYTHFVRWPLPAGQALAVPIIAGTLLAEPFESANPRPVLKRLRLPTASDAGAVLRYRFSVTGELLAEGTFGVAPGDGITSADLTLGVDLPKHPRHDAGTAVLELTTLDGGVTLFAATTGDDPQGACGAISRASWRGTESGAWVADAGHFDLAFDLEEATRQVAYLDEDRDGFGNPMKPNATHVPPYTSMAGTDCDDSRTSVHPGAQELCNGLDDDCDQSVDGQDTDLLLVPCGLDAGVCRASATHSRGLCIGGEWQACGTAEFGADYQVDETKCDGKDNDCDGEVDEFTDGPTCALTKGVCSDTRAKVCSQASWVACGASEYGPDYELEESKCDGLDNDCDGQADEGCPEKPKGCGCSGVAGFPLVLLALAWRRRRT